MAYSTPLTAVSNATLTAAQWNASVRDNLLETAPAKATAAGRIFVTTGANAIAERVPSTNAVSATEGTTSTTYTDLTTVGPTVSVTTGTSALVAITSGMTQSAVGGYCNVSVVISGASSIAAGTSVLNFRSGATNQQMVASHFSMMTGLTAGTNTFKMQYNAGAAGGTATFFNRQLVVIPL